jgi:hypothetical protein
MAAHFKRNKLRSWKTLTNFQRMLPSRICPFISTSWNKGMGLQVGLGWWFLPVTLVVLGTCAFYLVRIFGAIRVG